MKNFKFILVTAILLVMSAVLPVYQTVFAENTPTPPAYEVVLPDGVQDYVDLTGLTTFCFEDENNMYYVINNSSNYYLYNYNFLNQQHALIDTFNSSIESVKFVNGNLFVQYDSRVQIYEFEEDGTAVYNNKDLHVGASITINTQYDICFSNNKYYVAYTSIPAKDESKRDLHIITFDNLENSSTATPITLNLNYTITNITVTDKYIIALGNDNKLHCFDHTASPITDNAPTTSNDNTINDLLSFKLGSGYYYLTSCTNGNIYVYNMEHSLVTTLSSFNLPTNIWYNQNTLYVYDANINNIQTSAVNEGTSEVEFAPTRVILAGKGSDVGRFDGVNFITLKNNNSLFVSDYNNNRIQIINSASGVKVIENVFKPSNLVLDNKNNLIFLKTNQEGTQKYLCGLDYTNGNYTTQLFEDIEVDNGITSLTMDNSGKLYALNSTNNKIYCYNSYSEDPIETAILDVTANENSQIVYSEMHSSLLLTIDNQVYTLIVKTDNSADVMHGKPTALQTTTANISKIDVDYSGNVYILSNNKIYKRDYATPTILAELDCKCDCDTFTINQADGKIYIFNKNKACLQSISYPTYSDGLSNYEHNYEQILGNTGREDIVKFGTLKQNVFIYSTVNYKGDFKFTGNSSITALVINEPISANGFVQIAYVENGELKIGYVDTSDIVIATNIYLQNEYQLRAVNQTVRVYKYPTIAGNIVSRNISMGTVFTCVGMYNGSLDGSNSGFYVVKEGNRYGYVYEGDVTRSIATSQNFDTNASIRILDHSEVIYIYDTLPNGEAEPTKSVINNGQRIYVKNYDKSHQYTLITYVDADHVQHEGYVKTQYINMDGISQSLVITIVLFCLGILLTVAIIVFYVIYKKRQKHNDEDIEKVKTTKKAKTKQPATNDIQQEDNNTESDLSEEN